MSRDQAVTLSLPTPLRPCARRTDDRSDEAPILERTFSASGSVPTQVVAIYGVEVGEVRCLGSSLNPTELLHYASGMAVRLGNVKNIGPSLVEPAPPFV